MGYDPLSGNKTGTTKRRGSITRRTPSTSNIARTDVPQLSGRQQFEDRENYINEARRAGLTAPAQSLEIAYANPLARSNLSPAPPTPKGPGGGGSRGYGGGGGGPSAASLAQSQLDYLLPLLAGKSYTAGPMTGVRDSINALRDNVLTANQQDQQAATGAYNTLDQWLAANQTNPYANVQLQNARVSNVGNPYLDSQGLSRLNEVGQNPEDIGARNAFQNVLSLLGAGQQSANQSRLAESQMARTYAGQQIGALDNAYLANIDTRLADVSAKEYEAQRVLDAEKRQAAMQLAALLGQGATAPPDILAQLGLA